jgi:hypothetical protein
VKQREIIILAWHNGVGEPPTFFFFQKKNPVQNKVLKKNCIRGKFYNLKKN